MLVAEDEESLRGMLALVLQGRGYEALLCADGLDAERMLDSDAPIDAALLDVRMPRRTGPEVIAHLRALPARAHLPVIAMSAFSDEVSAQSLLDAGADAFLAKPFTIQELTDALATLLAARHPA